MLSRPRNRRWPATRTISGSECSAAPRAAASKSLLGLALVFGPGHGWCQDFYYVEPGVASCPAAPAATAAAPKSIPRGVAVPGRIRVACGFEAGSYTVTLNSSDAGAVFSPKTFLVNFGRIVGNGVYSVRFATPGVQSISTSITSNMGSPPVRGNFVSPANTFNIVIP
jgi:hypothetical protein